MNQEVIKLVENSYSLQKNMKTYRKKSDVNFLRE